jgi:hypothetical protein
VAIFGHTSTTLNKRFVNPQGIRAYAKRAASV